MGFLLYVKGPPASTAASVTGHAVQLGRRIVLSGGAERSGAGPVAAGAPPNGIGGRERAWLVVAAPDRRSSESVAHGTTRRPPIPFGSPPSAPPAPERPALLKDNGCDNLEEM